jgi:hypothetical protein
MRVWVVGLVICSAAHVAPHAAGAQGAVAHDTTPLRRGASSFAAVWRSACGTGQPPADSAILYGVVTLGLSATRVSGANVEATWRASGNARGPLSDVHRTASTDSTGTFALCGIPVQQSVSIYASAGENATTPVSFHVGAAHLDRRDLAIPTAEAIDQLLADNAPSAPLVHAADGATLHGMARDSAGNPVPRARVSISGVANEWRTNDDGTFIVQGVPAGARVVGIRALGFAAERRLVEVAARDSVYVGVSMAPFVAPLRTVTVRERARLDARKAELDERRRMGFGYRADSSDFKKVINVSQTLSFPGVHIVWIGGEWGIYMSGVYSLPAKGSSRAVLTCNPAIFIDGMRSDMDMVNTLNKDEIALIEVFNSAARAPLQCAGGSNCGVVLFWLKGYISP